MEPNKEGKIITFYSFKGGVGRTMSLANVAALLAKWGHKILIVDFDLEAPGIEKYFFSNGFDPSQKRDQCNGVVDWLESIGQNKPLAWESCLISASSAKFNVQLDIFSAGKDSPDYPAKLQNISWDALFEQNDLSDVLERVRNEWKKRYDFVFIDSRTGISDIGGICTIYLPDIIAFLFTTNEASLNGCLDVVKRAREARSKLPYDRSLLITIPIPSRDESRSEYESSLRWKEIFAAELKPFYNDWLPQSISILSAIDILKIPYIAYWSFGDRLPVLEEGTNESTIGYTYERIALLIAGNFDWNTVKTGFTSTDVDSIKKNERLLLDKEKTQNKRTVIYAIISIAAVILVSLAITLVMPNTEYYKEWKFEKELNDIPDLPEQLQAAGGHKDSIRSLTVDASNFALLRGKLHFFKHLDSLTINGALIKDLQMLNDVDSLHYLSINSCDRLENLKGIEKLEEIRHLEILYSSRLKDSRGVEKLKRLKTLYLGLYSNLLNLEPLSKLRSLVSLNIYNNSSVDLGKLKGLSIKKLSLDYYDSVAQQFPLVSLELNYTSSEDLRGISSIKTLRSLVLNGSHYRNYYGHYERLDLSMLNSLNSLKSLKIDKATIQNLEAIEKLKLDTLIFSNDTLQTIESITKVKTLRYLELMQIAWFRPLPNLNLDLKGFDSLKYLDAEGFALKNVNNLTQLEEIKIYEDKIPALNPLVRLKSVQVDLSYLDAANLISYFNPSAVTKLSILYPNKSSVPTIANHFKELTELHILNDSSVSCKGLEKFRKLKYLEIQNSKLKTLSGLESLGQLQTLVITGCDSLSDISVIRSLKSLNTLHLSSNQGYEMINIEPIYECINLKKLIISSDYEIDYARLKKQNPLISLVRN